MPHFLDIASLSSDDLRAILTQAVDMKTKRANLSKGQYDDVKPLDGKMVALIFEKPSTRTRVSFDLGVRQMGGQTMVLPGTDIHLGHGETIADTARVLSRYVDLIMVRTFEEQKLLDLAEYAAVPVINGLTNRTHPCQIMADVMTFEEHRGSIKGKKVVWLGDGNNVCASFIHAAVKFEFDLVFSGPDACAPERQFITWADENGVRVDHEPDPTIAVMGADLVVTDTWMSMHDTKDVAAHRSALLHPYQVNSDVMKLAKPDAVFMHCLPAYREKEVTSEVMDGPSSVVFDEAENRLHAQKAIMRYCLNV